MPTGFYQRPTLEERFNRCFTKGSPDECWEWAGCLDNKGYGVIKGGSRMVKAHRLSLEMYLGRPLSEGMYVLHSCDNPSCVNPSHLREGTPQDNMDDKMSRGRWSNGERKLTWEKVAEIRSRVGQTQASLAAEFGISTSQVKRIRNNKRWIVRSAS